MILAAAAAGSGIDWTQIITTAMTLALGGTGVGIVGIGWREFKAHRARARAAAAEDTADAADTRAIDLATLMRRTAVDEVARASDALERMDRQLAAQRSDNEALRADNAALRRALDEERVQNRELRDLWATSSAATAAHILRLERALVDGGVPVPPPPPAPVTPVIERRHRDEPYDGPDRRRS